MGASFPGVSRRHPLVPCLGGRRGGAAGGGHREEVRGVHDLALARGRARGLRAVLARHTEPDVPEDPDEAVARARLDEAAAGLRVRARVASSHQVRARARLGDAVDDHVDPLVVERHEPGDAGDGRGGLVVGPGEVVVPAD
ncbi:MAG: hypothetical protein K0S40_3845 [Actinomycetospora sp.]|nr:hypothetical protein [Actinomycetospora sp.]